MDTSYRKWLRDELERRANRNPLYSLRSFARDLELSPSLLSEVISGKHGLSLRTGERIATKLGLSAEEKERFIDLLESEGSKSLRKRNEARARIVRRGSDYRQLTLDHYQVISDWYHFAILELTQTEGFRSDLKWIAKKLSVPMVSVEAAIERLKRLELLSEKKGKLSANQEFIASPDGVPSEAIRNSHERVLGKAIQALQVQSVSERNFSNIILAFNQAQLPEAAGMIRDFRRKFDRKMSRADKKDSVYCLAIQLFALSEPTQEKKK